MLADLASISAIRLRQSLPPTDRGKTCAPRPDRLPVAAPALHSSSRGRRSQNLHSFAQKLPPRPCNVHFYFPRKPRSSPSSIVPDPHGQKPVSARDRLGETASTPGKDEW